MSAIAQRQAASAASLKTFGAAAAIAGGGLRIISTFIPYEAGSASLEALYGVIDLCLLFGLLGVYLATAEKVGLAGLGFFLVAMSGLASIVGPDAQAFGVDFYRAGALVFVIGLAGFSVQLLRGGMLAPSAMLWIVTLACSLASAFAPPMFIGAGVALGAGFAAAGYSVLRGKA